MGRQKMVLAEVDLFCPCCEESGNLWVSPTYFYRVECKMCGKKWAYNELNKICTKLVQKAKSDRSFQWWADCLKIQMQHMINPFTGKCYAKT